MHLCDVLEIEPTGEAYVLVDANRFAPNIKAVSAYISVKCGDILGAYIGTLDFDRLLLQNAKTMCFEVEIQDTYLVTLLAPNPDSREPVKKTVFATWEEMTWNPICRGRLVQWMRRQGVTMDPKQTCSIWAKFSRGDSTRDIV